MAVIHFKFDVDSDVHPELHAALSGIARSASRGERFRQLAASGLIWEVVRSHGYAASVVAPSGAQPGARPEVEAQGIPPVAVTPVPIAAFVNLEPAAAGAPMQTMSAWAAVPVPGRGADVVARQIPVLVDVVVLDPLLQPIALATARPAEPATAAPIRAVDRLQRAPPVAAPSDDLVDGADESTGHVEHLPPVSSLEQSPSTWSRLKRMKERGLFKNG